MAGKCMRMLIFFSTYIPYPARLLSFFGTPGLDVVMMRSLLTSCICKAHWRFLHFHGQRHARLMRDKTVYDKSSRKRSIFISLLSPLLFLAPEVHLREMETLWTDDVIIESVWKKFISKLLGEWNDLILWVRSYVSLELYSSLT